MNQCYYLFTPSVWLIYYPLFIECTKHSYVIFRFLAGYFDGVVLIICFSAYAECTLIFINSLFLSAYAECILIFSLIVKQLVYGLLHGKNMLNKRLIKLYIGVAFGLLCGIMFCYDPHSLFLIFFVCRIRLLMLMFFLLMLMAFFIQSRSVLIAFSMK